MRFALLTCALLLAGCQPPLARLKSLSPEANDFPSALAAEYLSYADSEAEQGRAAVADRFAAKGLDALEGEPPPPDSVAGLSADAAEELSGERELLLAVLSDDARRVAPQKAARAQLLFDCWLHQARSAQAPDCADEFHASVGELQEIATLLNDGEEKNHGIDFAPHSAVPDGKASAMIRAIARRAVRAKIYSVELEGGGRELGEKRLLAVKAALVAAGMDGDRIHVVRMSQAVRLSCDTEPGAGERVNVTVRIYREGR